ncbi:MAG: HypC/HybG/HupF family hydrogenase formation chaperone [Actinobacteria bacterium]|nr:HypC/HybG/HupF family hydrogenase formation chaperone [Actinomycetota bacterium]
MCLGVPGKIVSIEELAGFRLAEVDISGTKRKVSLDMLPDAQVGDYVLVHAGYAVQVIDEEAAKETLNYLEQIEWSD